MAIRQLSVFMENQKGALSDIAAQLADAGIDLRAMSVADTQDYGILRLIVDDVDRAAEVLKSTGRIATVTPVIAARIPDEPGGLAHVLRVLTDADVNLEYLYAFIAVSGKNANVVIRVQDNARAEALLAEAGIPLLTEADIREM